MVQRNQQLFTNPKPCLSSELIARTPTGHDVKEFECPICLDLIVDPVECTLCQISFGASCLKRAKLKCPFCRGGSFSRSHRYFKNALEEI